jgi:ribose-phosphate pyrophosphokinase
MTILFSFPEQQPLAASLCVAAQHERGAWEWRRFPDGESYVRIESDVRAKPAIILCSLNNPDEKTLALIYLAKTLKELGASKITLIAPYLGYMRQDKRFNEGEAVTSEIFAKFLSGYIDALVTIDPHLHRHKNLVEIYDCACTVLSATPLMTEWIKTHIEKPLIVGPDMESEQWVADVARHTNAPYVILEKTRHGDRDVDIRLPDVSRYQNLQPVLLDDIISSAVTMNVAIARLRERGFAQITCIATHGIFADDSYKKMIASGAVQIVTANTIPHPTNGLDITPLLTVL